jgi:hypothetical protein
MQWRLDHQFHRRQAEAGAIVDNIAMLPQLSITLLRLKYQQKPLRQSGVLHGSERWNRLQLTPHNLNCSHVFLDHLSQSPVLLWQRQRHSQRLQLPARHQSNSFRSVTFTWSRLSWFQSVTGSCVSYECVAAPKLHVTVIYSTLQRGFFCSVMPAVDIMELLRQRRCRVLKRVPKASRITAAEKLAEMLRLVQGSHKNWKSRNCQGKKFSQGSQGS